MSLRRWIPLASLERMTDSRSRTQKISSLARDELEPGDPNGVASSEADSFHPHHFSHVQGELSSIYAVLKVIH